MPKNPTGISGDQCKQAIRKVLEVHGRLTAEPLFGYVIDYLSKYQDPNNDGNLHEQLKKALYKHLKTLVLDGELRTQYFRQNGIQLTKKEIETLEDKTFEAAKKNEKAGQNYYQEWYLKGYHQDVEGAKLLKQQGGNYFVPNKSMLSAIAINEACEDKILNSFKIIFSAGNKTLSISIDRRQVPTNIVVARNNAEIGFTPPLEELENQFNKHATLLMLPGRTLSSCRAPQRMGHFLLQFINDTEVSVADLGSHNGTEVLKLSNEDYAELTDSIKHSNNLTLKYSPFAAEVEAKAGFFTKVADEPKIFKLPVLIMASKECRILVR